jgi:3-dehydrosphinganine reductase
VARPRVASFRGWRVLITGGSSGIGLSLARILVGEGAKVCIVARDERRLKDACQELAASAEPDNPPCYRVLDLTSADAIAAELPHILHALGGLDLLINNAGYAQPGYVQQLDDEAYTRMMAVNYFGPMRLCRALLPHFIEQRAGRIVNVTSMLGFMGTFGYSAYAASKYALAGFTECLRQDVLPYGIRVHLCYPPTTRTPGLERENHDKPPETWAIEGKSRAFSPEQVAGAVLNGVRRGRFHILVGFDSWLIWMLQRLTPWFVRRLTDRVLWKHLERAPSAPATEKSSGSY